MRLFVFILCLSLIHCRREDSDVVEPIDVIVEDTETYFDSDLIGQVDNDNGKALQDVFIQMGTSTILTYENGTFIFNNAKTNLAGSLIYLKKDDYFDKYYFEKKSVNQVSNLQITMLEKKKFATIDASLAKRLNLTNDLTLDIEAQSFKTESGDHYNGQIQVYLDFDAVDGKIPIIDRNLKKGIFTESISFKLYFESSDGLPLKIAKPLILSSLSSDKSIAKLDTKKQKWVEMEASNMGNVRQVSITEDVPYCIGKIKALVQVQMQIVSPLNMGVCFTKVEIQSENETWHIQPSQGGDVEFYCPSNTRLDIKIVDICGQTLASNTIITQASGIQETPKMVLAEDQLRIIESNIDGCGEVLNGRDLIQLHLQGTDKKVTAYQNQNQQKFLLPNCIKIEKATYYRAKDLKYSVLFSGSIQQQKLLINGVPFCIEKIAGYFSVDEKPIFLNTDQFYIYLEKSNVRNLIISDLTGFMISIQDVLGKGKYKPDVILFNHPSVTDCQESTCTNMTAWIDEYGSPGSIAKIRIEGTIDGKFVKGMFVNLLKN